MPFDLTAEEWSSLLQGLARGEYEVLLGAGASLGATGGDGRPLPDGKTLARELATDFAVDTADDDVELRTIYEIVEDLQDSQGRNRTRYFKDRFSNCRPTWHPLIASIRWRRIWSLNIDDVIERAYATDENRLRIKIEGSSWVRPYAEPDTKGEKLQVVHLHGYAPTLDEAAPDLIFSILEYVQAASTRYAWHRVLGDMFLQRPFIVVGARLADEFDLAEFLRRGSSAKELTGRPALIVLRQISKLNKRQFRKWGLVPVEAEAEQFFSVLKAEIQSVEAGIAGLLPGPQTTQLVPQAITFLNQFAWLRTDKKATVSQGHDFYLGHDPEWSDILADNDASFQIPSGCAAHIAVPERDSAVRQEVHCLWGGPGSGKTTALLRIARILIARGADAFLFRGEQRLDRGAAIWWVQRSPRSVLLFDGLGDVAEDVGRLIADCEAAKVPVLVVSTERSRRTHELYADFAPDVLRLGAEHEMDVLTDPDIDRLVEKLQSRRRLGKLTRVGLQARRDYFRKNARRQLLAGMAELEGGGGFRARITRELREINDPACRQVYVLAAMAYVFGHPLPIATGCVAAGISREELHRHLGRGGALADVLRIESKGVAPRHRTVANIVVENGMNVDTRFSASLLLARALAPLISPATIRQRTIPYRIARNLMNENVISAWVGALRARDWYEALVAEYSWNARFWEQRALVEARLGALAKARSFAEEAVRIQRHSYTLNTLATVLMMLAEEELGGSITRAEAVLWEAIVALRESRRHLIGLSEYPYITFFSHALRFVEAAYRSERIPQKLTAEWSQWMRDASAARVFQYENLRRRLHQFQERWLHRAVRSSSRHA